MPWYVLKVRASQEKKVAHRIQAELDRLAISHQVREIVIPMERVLESRKTGKKREKEKVFMPGYLFLEVAAESYLPDLIPFMRSIPDVLYFVAPARGQMPEPLPEQEITPILLRARAKEAVPEAWHELAVGDAVRIVEGPFTGFEGVISELYPEKQRARVQVKVFNRETPVDIQYHQIEKL
jgi:transcriptional antiterminator NusG